MLGIIIIAVLINSFCFLGLIQAAWLSATPNFPQERTNRNMLIWGTGFILSLLTMLVCVSQFVLNFFSERKHKK